MALLPLNVLAVVSAVMLEGLVMLLLCILVMGFLVVAGLGVGFGWFLSWLLKFFDKKYERRHADSFDSSQGREVDIRQQDDNPLPATPENQSQPNKENDWQQ